MLAVMRAFGADVQAADDLTKFEIGLSGYLALANTTSSRTRRPRAIFWAAAAITGGALRVQGYRTNGVCKATLVFANFSRMGWTRNTMTKAQRLPVGHWSGSTWT